MFGGGKKVVGLDVGSHQVKAVEVKKSGNRFELAALGVADVYPGGDRTAMTGDIMQMRISAVQQAMQRGNISARYCVAAVSGESIIVRYVQMPEMQQNELREAIRWEAEEYIPFSLDEVYLDHMVLGPSAVPDKVDVLLVAARRELVGDHASLLRMAGLTPLIMDVEGFAFVNCFEVLYQPSAQDCICLLNVGAEVSNINIYVGGTSRFSRDIGVAGNSITEAVAQKANLPYARAEEMKIAVGAQKPAAEETEEGGTELISTIRGAVERITGSDLGEDTPEATAGKAIHSSLSQLVSEVRRSIQFFEGQSGGLTVQRLIIGGGTARMNNLPSFLQSELDVSVEKFDPTRGLTIGRDVDKVLIENHAEQLGPAIGLALRKVLD